MSTAHGSAKRRSAKRLHTLTAAASVAGHLLVLLVLLSAHGDTYKAVAPEPVTVELAPPWVPPAPPAPTPAPTPQASPAPAQASPAPPAPAKPSPPKGIARRSPAPAAVESPVPAGEGESLDAGDELSAAQLASATPAGSGPSGRPCDMARRLQAALRRDARVQAAVADVRRADGTAAKALWVWNGEWIRSHGQDGNGLAAVREAIQWEVAFAPAACRAEPVRGLILLSLNDHPGAPGLVVGSDRWLWSDLLGLRR